MNAFPSLVRSSSPSPIPEEDHAAACRALYSLCTAVYFALTLFAFWRLILKCRGDGPLTAGSSLWGRARCCCCCCSSTLEPGGEPGRSGFTAEFSMINSSGGDNSFPRESSSRVVVGPAPFVGPRRAQGFVGNSSDALKGSDALVGPSSVMLINAPGNAPQWEVRSSRATLVVLVTLFAYALCRSVQLFMFSCCLDPLKMTDVSIYFYTFLPCVFFLSLQAALLHKWVLHVADLTAALSKQSFPLGPFLVTCSVFFVVVQVLITVVAFVDVIIFHFSGMRDKFWDFLGTFSCGVTYIFNGASFFGLGVVLRRLWSPIEQEVGVGVRMRILGMAFVFGFACVARGVLLCIFEWDAGETTAAANTVHSYWGSQMMLLIEWCCVVVSLVVLSAKR